MPDLSASWQQIVTAIAGIVWAVRLEGKVKTQEAINGVQNKDIIQRLDRIERKQDAAAIVVATTHTP